MKTNDIIRAWRDAEFMNSLSAEERAMLPANPAGDVELSDDDLAGINGGNQPDAPTALCTPPCTVVTALVCIPGLVTWAFRCWTRFPFLC